ncbi:MAG: glutamyl-tRNA reductase [Pseudomonadota bacterium]
MPLYVLGLNHRTAPIDIREKVAFTNDRQRPALEALHQSSSADEVVLVSTCNRTELYLRGANESVVERAVDWLQATPEARHQNLRPHLYRHVDADATRHAFRVAAGLDSMVLGEPQILGQVKYAVKVANEAGMLSGPLDRLFQETFQVAKKVRSQTEIGSTSVSMAAASLKLAKQLFGDIREIRVLFIGVGEMIHLSATHFAAQSPKAMVVANRTLARGREFALEFDTNGNMSAIALAELPDCIHEFDAIITSTASSLPIIGKGMIEQALKRRRNKPIFMVDLAVPRDIEHGVGELEDVYLYTLDTLGKMIQQNMATRASAVIAAEAIIDTHTVQFMQWLTARNAVPVIQQLRGKVEQYRQIELERAQKMLTKGVDPHRVLEALAQGLTNKFLHNPMEALKRATETERESLTNALKMLYPENPEEEEE